MAVQNQQSTAATGWGLALEKAPQFLSVVLLFSIPFMTQLEGQDPLFPKFAVTQILVYLMLAAWALQVAFTGRLVWVSSRAFWVLWLFLAWAALAAFFSPYPRVCLMEMRDYAVYPLWYFLLTFNCLEAWQGENLLISLLSSGWAASLWALGQAFGMGRGGWSAVAKAEFAGRPVAGLGTPDSLAGFLLMVWPLALALWMRAEKGITRFLWGSLCLCCLATLLLTASQAGWVGLVAGTAVFSILTLKDRGRQGFKWIGVLWVTLAACLILPPMSTSLRDLWNWKGDGLQYRGQIWKGSLEIIKRNPLWGVGHGAFAAAFPSCRPPALMMNQAQAGYGVDHAQNWVLEWVAETGIMGCLLLMAFWFYVLAQWWRLYRANAVSKPLAVGIFAAVAGVAADNLLDANSYLPSTRIPLLFLAAFPVALSHRFFRMEGFPVRLREVDLSWARIYLLPVLAVIGAIALNRVEDAFRRQGAQVELKRASDLTQVGKWTESLPFYDKVLELDPQNITGLYGRGCAYFDRNQPGDKEKALAGFNAVEEISPDYQQVHFQKYKVLGQLKRMEDAQAELRLAVKVDPTLIYLLEDFKKARSLASDRRFAEAMMVYQNLAFDYPTCVPLLISYANCDAMSGNPEAAMNLYRYSLKLDPGNPKALYDLQKLGDVVSRRRQINHPKSNVIGSELE